MRVAVISEGDSEYASLSLLYPQLAELTGHVMLGPYRLNITPLADVRRIARECKPLLRIAATKRADLALVLLDREQRQECPGRLAQQLEAEISRTCAPGPPARVVIKDRTYESWLIADLAALRAQPRRFAVSRAIERKVTPNRADSCGADELLERAAVGPPYDKVKDSQRICARLDVEAAAMHSRSLRHMLHVLGAATYAQQCRLPTRAR